MAAPVGGGQKLSQGLTGRPDEDVAKSLTALLTKRADAGGETAARQLAGLPADRGDVESR
jgi:hypothetical protein